MSKKPSARDVAAEITALIVAKLEAGVPPWRRPWSMAGGGRPLRHCSTPYTGINALYLWAIADARGYRGRHWMTLRQATQLGGHVRRGETGSHSVFFSSLRRTDRDRRTGEEVERSIRFLRAYTVFAADQIDGLPESYYPASVPDVPTLPSCRQDTIDAFFGSVPAAVRHGGDHAYCDTERDYIQLPPRPAFRTADHYASVRAHETVHWTGHPSRLDRRFGRRFGDKAYAFEELVAEIGAGFVCADLDLPCELHEGHASYVHHWLGILKADTSAIIHAAAKAEQALRLLRSFQPESALPPPAA